MPLGQDDGPDALSVLVAVATYKRPDMLRACLASLVDQLDQSDRLVVVDNDPNASALGVAADFGDSVIYLHEPSPGISPARNRALGYFHSQSLGALAFIDDDEVAAPDWLARMREGRNSSRQAAAFFGPVLPIYPAGVRRWITASGVFERPRFASMSDVKWPATNNVLISGVFLRQNRQLSFDEAYALKGGEDTDFFFRARALGAEFTWLDEALVYEAIPAERARLSWLWRRGLRLGNVSAETLLRQNWSTSRVALVAVGRILAAPLLALRTVVTGGRPGADIMNLPKGFGMLGALLGSEVHEYARK